jgi:hypothetical protein
MLPTSIVRRTMDVTVFGGIWPMRICIYKTDEAPELTLLLREGLPIPGDTKVRKWTHFKAVTRGEVRTDLLTEIDGHGYFLVRLGALLRH